MTTDLDRYTGGAPEPYERSPVPVIANDIIRPRLPEVGRIRCGEKDAKKGYPRKLDTFRFTSRERPLIEAVAKLYGGQVKPWASDEGPQWQVVSESNSIDVIVPTADLAFSQYYELWDGGGCQRRCDGRYEMLGDRQCVCNPAERGAGKEGTCRPTTRLGVFLPGIKGLGIWRLESHGKNAGSEIKGAVMLIAAYGAGLTRATLTTAIRPGRVKNNKGEWTPVRYVVPTLIAAEDLDTMVDRAQLEASPVRGVLPSSHDYPAPTDPKMRELFAAYREVFPKPAEMDALFYRFQRLAWSAKVLGRDVPSWNGPIAPKTLDYTDVQTLIDALEATQPASAREPAAPALSTPSSSAPGAESTAPQSSAGNPTDVSPARPVVGEAIPAEHHTEAPGGRAATPDETPDGEAVGEGKRQPSGSSVPVRRPRSATTAQLREHQQQAEATRKQQVVERESADPLQSMIPSFRVPYLEHFGNDLEAAREEANRHISSWTEAGTWPAEGKFAPWSKEFYLELAADTFEAEKYR